MKKENKSNAATLRQKAEELLKEKQSRAGSLLSEAEMQNLIHELGVHQIELELQNEELVLSEKEAEAASKKYAELYDLAPSGYFTLSKEGEIIELNLFGAQMLGKERSHLKNSMFGFFVSDDTKPFSIFFSGKYLMATLKNRAKLPYQRMGTRPCMFTLPESLPKTDNNV